jgi:hypothetical protein
MNNTSMVPTYYRGEDSKKNVSSSSSPLSHNKRSKVENSGANNNDYIYPDNAIINSLDIADGLKELLIKYEFTLEELLTTCISDLAEYLGIDLYVANIICNAAKKLSSSNNLEEGIAQNNNNAVLLA